MGSFSTRILNLLLEEDVDSGKAQPVKPLFASKDETNKKTEDDQNLRERKRQRNDGEDMQTRKDTENYTKDSCSTLSFLESLYYSDISSHLVNSPSLILGADVIYHHYDMNKLFSSLSYFFLLNSDAVFLTLYQDRGMESIYELLQKWQLTAEILSLPDMHSIYQTESEISLEAWTEDLLNTREECNNNNSTGFICEESEEVSFEIEEGVRSRSVYNESTTIPARKARNEYTDQHGKVKRSWNDDGVPLESFMLLKIYMKKKK